MLLMVQAVRTEGVVDTDLLSVPSLAVDPYSVSVSFSVSMEGRGCY